MTDTLYIPSVLNSYFLDKLRKLPVGKVFTSQGETADVIAYKVYGDTNMAWIIKMYNNITHPYDGSFTIGSVIKCPSLTSIEKLYATLTALKRSESTT
jgi:hypothetical protein